MMYTGARVASRNSAFALLLLVLFCLSFSVPFLIAANLKNYFHSNRRALIDSDAQFVDATSISNPNTFLSVPHADGLNPLPGNDYLISVWFRMGRMPQEREKIVFLGKGSAEMGASGFLIGLARDDERLRPIVYWADSTHGGKWYEFSELDLLPQTWTVLALSFLDGRYLGLHSVSLNAKGKADIRLLGGYEVLEGTFPDSTSALMIGSVNGSRFRGKVGPVGVFQSTSVGSELSAILRSLAESPLNAPTEFSGAEIKLWAPTSRNDRSRFAHHIELVSPLKK